VKLEDVTAELLALPLEQFTERRNERAKALKASGQGELGAEVSRLKKPPVHLWAANMVARQEPAMLRKARQAAQAVARAQTARGQTARELRTASEAFQQELDALGREAEKALTGGGHTATEETVRRTREIFRRAALEGGQTWDRLQRGALISEPAAGDDVISMFQAGAPVAKGKAREPESEADDPHAARAAERTARMDAERAEQLEEVARRLRAEAEQAAEQARRAEERAAAGEQQAREARRQAAKSARAVEKRR
jgi:hypothetical protein